MIYVDSNYWIYWLDERLPEHPHVEKTMKGAIKEGVVINRVTLMEVAHYMRMLPKQKFIQQVGAIQNLATLTLFDLDARISNTAVGMLPEQAPKGLGSRDCVILATMKATGIESIATHDRAFKSVRGIKVIDEIPS